MNKTNDLIFFGVLLIANEISFYLGENKLWSGIFMFLMWVTFVCIYFFSKNHDK